MENAIKIRKRFRDFQNFLFNATDKEKESALTIPTKKRKAEILKKVITQLNN